MFISVKDFIILSLKQLGFELCGSTYTFFFLIFFNSNATDLYYLPLVESTDAQLKDTKDPLMPEADSKLWTDYLLCGLLVPLTSEFFKGQLCF